MTQKHTPTQGMRLPWHDMKYKIQNDDGEVVGLNNHQAGIVKCVNMHDELVEALEAMYIAALNSDLNSLSNNEGCDAFALAYPALKKAGAL